MRNYWSCSKFADWLRGTEKPHAEDSKGWRAWRNLAQKAHPYRYWLAEEGLDHLQDIWCYIPERINDVRYYINNRWISRTHACTASPRDIPRGEWRDVGNRFLPCLFNELVDFVEVEQAWHHCLWSEEAREKYRTPWTRTFFRFRTWRCPEAGLDYLHWAKTLTNVEFLAEEDKHLAEPTYQAKAAQEILELYHWWKEIYPKRPDPYDASGWTEYCELRRQRGYDILDMDDKNPEEANMSKTSLEKLREIEESYEKEDEEMMIRLIKIRQSLWT